MEKENPYIEKQKQHEKRIYSKNELPVSSLPKELEGLVRVIREGNDNKLYQRLE